MPAPTPDAPSAAPVALPYADEVVACVDWAQQLGADPAGTALAPDVVLLVEVDEPWPKPVAKHERLAGVVRAVQTRSGQTRVLAAIPHDSTSPRLIAFARSATGALRVDHQRSSDDAADVAAVWASLEAGDGVGLSSSSPPTTMLVCTQGSHDVCCGTVGSAFADRVANRDIELFRVSHTGGHKWSPTAMTLPDGRMWAHLDDDATVAVLDRTEPASEVSAKCRGWWGAATGPAQVAEIALLAEIGWEVDGWERAVDRHDRGDGSVRVKVRASSPSGAIERHFDARVAREVPAIMCSVPGGEPAKTATEWKLTPIADDDHA